MMISAATSTVPAWAAMPVLIAARIASSRTGAAAFALCVPAARNRRDQRARRLALVTRLVAHEDGLHERAVVRVAVPTFVWVLRRGPVRGRDQEADHQQHHGHQRPHAERELCCFPKLRLDGARPPRARGWRGWRKELPTLLDDPCLWKLHVHPSMTVILRPASPN